jgi:hypothetical protein
VAKESWRGKDRPLKDPGRSHRCVASQRADASASIRVTRRELTPASPVILRAVVACGDRHPCHRFVGSEDVRLGHLGACFVDVGVHGQEHTAERGVVSDVDHDALGGERPKVRAAADLHGSMARPASPGYEDGALPGGRQWRS